MPRETPVCSEDVFSRESVRNARTVDDALRELAPVVRLSRENITMIGRYEHVAASLKDWRTFSSRSRPWHDPDSVRPEILLVDDPPRHTQVRNIVSNALSPRALSRMAESFRADADALLREVKQRSGTAIDVVQEITQAFVYKVLPDLLGLPKAGREHLYAFGHMVWATLGPQNELFAEAMQNTGPVIAWVDQCCNRENLDPEGLGMQMFRAADEGQITEPEAKLLIQVLLSAAADTTVMTAATALRAFSLFPEQYQLLRAEPGLAKDAFEESLRWDSPSRMAGRITTREVQIEGYVVPSGERCGLMFAAANRDPRKWSDPDRFDIRRDNRGHVGWGYGLHACVGRVLAVLEAEALLGACIRHIERFEPAGEPAPWMTAIGHGPVKLPLVITAAAA
ncbi:MAG TPA: cytochrome P450 [Steroidobacteraceae bacterium]|nr:cytochrome P450 [Steroidobacteraceae bacterium]